MSSSRTVLVLLTLFLVMFTSSSQFLIVAPILPRIIDQLDMAEELGGTLVSIYAAMVATFSLIAGPISDRVGRVAILRVGTAVMAVALLMHAAVWDYPSMLLARGLAGMSSGILAGASAAYVGDAFPYERRGMAMGWVMSGMAFGQIIGIPAGTILADAGGFALPFVAFGVAMLLTSALTLVALPKPDVEHQDHFGFASALRSYQVLVARRDVNAVNVGATAMMLSVGGFIVYLPTFLEQSLGATPNGIAVMFLLGGLAQAATGPVVGRLSDRVGRKSLVIAGSLGVAAFFAVTPLIPAFWMFLVGFPVVMSMVAMRITPLQALITALTDADHRGSLLSLNMAMSQLGFGIGSALAGWGYVYGFWTNAVGAAAFGVVAVAIIVLWVPEPEGIAPGFHRTRADPLG